MTKRKLTIGQTGRSGITVVHEGDDPVAIFLPAGAGTDPRTFVDAVKALHVPLPPAEPEKLAKPWDESGCYNPGDRVIHNGRIWEATCVIHNSYYEPGNIGPGDPGTVKRVPNRCNMKAWTDLGSAEPIVVEAAPEALTAPNWVKSLPEPVDPATVAVKMFQATLKGGHVKRGADESYPDWARRNAKHHGMTDAEADHVAGTAAKITDPRSRKGKLGIGDFLSDDKLVDILTGKSPRLKPNKGESFPDYYRRQAEADGVPTSIIDTIIGALDGDKKPDGAKVVDELGLGPALEAMEKIALEQGMGAVANPWKRGVSYPMGFVVMDGGRGWLALRDVNAISGSPEAQEAHDPESNPWLDITEAPVEESDHCILCRVAFKVKSLAAGAA